MSRHVTSRQDWISILVEEDESDMAAGPVAGQQPSNEQPQQEQSPPQTQNIIPDEQKGAAGAPENKGTDLVIDLEELEKPVTGGEGGDGPEVMGYTCANPESVEMPETGKGIPPV